MAEAICRDLAAGSAASASSVIAAGSARPRGAPRGLRLAGSGGPWARAGPATCRPAPRAGRPAPTTGRPAPAASTSAPRRPRQRCPPPRRSERGRWCRPTVSSLRPCRSGEPGSAAGTACMRRRPAVGSYAPRRRTRIGRRTACRSEPAVLQRTEASSGLGEQGRQDCVRRADSAAAEQAAVLPRDKRRCCRGTSRRTTSDFSLAPVAVQVHIRLDADSEIRPDTVGEISVARFGWMSAANFPVVKSGLMPVARFRWSSMAVGVRW